MPSQTCWGDKSGEEQVPQSTVVDEPSELSPLATTGPKPEPITPPPLEAIDAAIVRGVDFLLETQHKHGAWGGPQRTKSLNIYAPVPGSHRAFRTGVTSLALMALCEVRPLLDGQRLEKVEQAIDGGQEWLFKNASRLRRAEAEALYNVWGHAYACHAIRRLYDRAEGDEQLQAKLIKLLEYQVDRLERYTFVNGGWGYYDFAAHTRKPSGSPTSFTTATALIALKDAAELDVHYPDELAEKAIDSILRQRLPDFSYAYGEYLRLAPRYGINRPAGSLGRSQACNLALRMYDREEVTDEVIKTWLDRLYARNGWLSIGRKYPVPHESFFGVAGYFYYYGHFYAALCIEVLPEDEQPHFQEHLAHILLALQEKDGSWWDYPLYDYHQQWGTSMAIASLLRCRPATAAP